MPILKREVDCFPSNLFELSPVDRPWWAAYVRSRQEKGLARHLAQQGVGFYLPQAEKQVRRAGRTFVSHLPLFPGYVFLYARPQDRGHVLATGMVANFLSVPDQDELAEDLQRVHRILATGLPVEHQAALPPGTPVEVVDGVLQGLTGTVVRSGRQAAVYIQVRLIGQGVLVELDSRLLRPAEQLIAV